VAIENAQLLAGVGVPHAQRLVVAAGQHAALPSADTQTLQVPPVWPVKTQLLAVEKGVRNLFGAGMSEKVPDTFFFPRWRANVGKAVLRAGNGPAAGARSVGKLVRPRPRHFRDPKSGVTVPARSGKDRPNGGMRWPARSACRGRAGVCRDPAGRRQGAAEAGIPPGWEIEPTPRKIRGKRAKQQPDSAPDSAFFRPIRSAPPTNLLESYRTSSAAPALNSLIDSIRPPTCPGPSVWRWPHAVMDQPASTRREDRPGPMTGQAQSQGPRKGNESAGAGECRVAAFSLKKSANSNGGATAGRTGTGFRGGQKATAVPQRGEPVLTLAVQH